MYFLEFISLDSSIGNRNTTGSNFIFKSQKAIQIVMKNQNIIFNMIVIFSLWLTALLVGESLNPVTPFKTQFFYSRYDLSWAGSILQFFFFHWRRVHECVWKLSSIKLGFKSGTGILYCMWFLLYIYIRLYLYLFYHI